MVKSSVIMKRIVRVFILVAAVFAMPLFVGCGGSKKSEPPTTDDKTSESAVTDGKKPEPKVKKSNKSKLAEKNRLFSEETRTIISNINTAILTYEVEVGHIPDSLDDLTVDIATRRSLLRKKDIVDAWRNPIQYRMLSKFKFEIRSAGPDEQMDTEDDITN